jgi:hypothetical protein
MITNVVCTALVVASFGLTSASASVRSISLKELATESTLVIVGKVTEVREIEGVPVARVLVLKKLKGDCASEVYFLAASTWTCDVSGAEEGEEALFFFRRYDFDPQPAPRPVADKDGRIEMSFGFKEPTGFKEQVSALLRGDELRQLAHSGRGRMPLRTVENRRYATVWVTDVGLPSSVSTISGPEAEYDFIRSVPLDELVRLVAEYVGS